MNNPLPMKKDGYTIHLAAKGCKTFDLAVVDSISASEAFCQYRDTFGFGASDMKRDCGNVTDQNGNFVARISYNGRVWNADGTEWRNHD